MSGMLLSCADMPIIKQVADLLGIILSGIYFLFDKVGIANMGLCIIVFTVIVRLLMIPMSIKQQKSMKLNSLINPEIQAIQKKYKGKSDTDSMMAMRTEMNAVYQKYGTSQTGGCLPMLIQMPIILALYGVISAIPSHVAAVGDLYDEATGYIYESMDEYSDLKTLNQIMVDNEIKGFSENKDFNSIVSGYYNPSLENLSGNKNTINELLTNSNKRQLLEGINKDKDVWYDMKLVKDTSLSIIDALKNVSEDDWKNVSSSDKLTDFQKNVLAKYSDGKKDYSKMSSDIVDNYEKMDDIREEVSSVYSFCGIDLSRSPSLEMEDGIWWAIFIPLLSAVFQWLSATISSKANQEQMKDNPMASSMKVMNVTMPLMSAFFCYSFASGLGLYWIIGSVIQTIQTVVLKKYFEKITVDDIIKSNIEKLNKKRAKQGLPPQKISAAANTNVKNIKTTTTNSNSSNKTNTSSGVTYKKGGIAAKANMVKEYNEKKK